MNVKNNENIENNNSNNKIGFCMFHGCVKKIKLIDYPCKCGNFYCKYHKNPETHNCSYDYKENNNKNQKIKELECKSNKIQKIN